jgi:two-component system, OmpR family, sensor histidine kinase MtrB
MSLRANLSAIVAFVAVLSLGGAAGFTWYSQRTTAAVVEGLHAIRTLQKLELDLLAHAHLRGTSDRSDLETRLTQDLREAERYIGNSTERSAFQRVESELADYLARAHDMPERQVVNLPELDAVHESLRHLLDINLMQAGQAENSAAQWETLVNRAVLLIALVLLSTIMVVLIWLWRLAFRPVLNIRDAMTEFAAGRKSARALESGPAELRSIAVQFNRMASALSRQQEEQLVFLAGVAHDLRNPLSPLKLAAATLGGDGPLPPEDRVRATLDIVRRQVDRLDRMVGDLLDASRIEAGQLELQLKECDAGLLAREVFELFQTASPRHRLDLHLPESAVPMRCDAFRIEQVLNNIVSNAIKYSPDGGTVKILVRADEASAVFEIADEGLGIRPEDIPSIFQPFRRVGKVDPKIPGIGLGLSVARHIVAAHGGNIDVKSRSGAGTVFFVTIPRLT